MSNGEDLVVFPQLKDEQNYVPYTFEFREVQDSQGLPNVEDWIDVFRRSIPSFVKAMKKDPSLSQDMRELGAIRFAEDFSAVCDTFVKDPSAAVDGFPPGKLDCIKLCRIRDKIQHANGFSDPFKPVKEEENAKALQYLPVLLKEIDGVEDVKERMELVIKGVFAGNIFDLGAAHTSELFHNGDVVFQETRQKLQTRPWTIDDLNVTIDALTAPKYSKAILFVDNAGSDVVLGMLPFARELLRNNCKVVLSANESPNINDITHSELVQLMLTVQDIDPLIKQALDSGNLCCISSGNDLPVIDLRYVSPQLAAQAQDTDLVVLEGMGRSIETNLNAEFKCDSLCLGMIKHPEVAACLQGELYGCVCKFKKH
eukprot:TRINITY_DN7530_c0_g1_i1.p1 TRINITY_DN7530_c0_g1~~TRINITY_DN7530_c0_g1_i1.p1  ORF type:complete len:370 (+),score=55.81 TRINITY_DN7530_c0_g1_i1:38-1147(+)